MVAINPQIQTTQDPSWYFRLSRPADPVNLHNAGAIALKDSGNILEGAIKGADQAVGTLAKTKEREAVEPERDAYERQLSSARTALLQGNANDVQSDAVGGIGSDTNARGAPLSILPEVTEGGQKLPADIENLPSRVAVLHGARAINGGPLSETDYYGRLAQITSEVRSRFPPAYADVIDAEAHRVLGFIPANAHIQAQVRDLQNAATGQDKIIAETERRLWEYSGRPGGDAAYQRFLASHDVNGAMPFLLRQRQADWQHDDIIRQRATMEAGSAIEKEFYGKQAETMAGSLATNIHLGSIEGAGLDSFKKIQQVLDDWYSGKIDKKALDENALVYDRLLSGWEDYYDREMDKQFKTPLEGDPLHRSMSQILGADEVGRIKAKNIESISNLHKMFRDKDYGMANYSHFVTAVREKTVLKDLYNSEAGPDLLVASQVSKAVGERNFGLFTQQANIPRVNEQIRVFTDKMRADMLAPDPTLGGTQKPTAANLKEAIGKLDTALDRVGVTNPQNRAAAFNAFMKVVDDRQGPSVINPETPDAVAEHAIMRLFDPKARDALRQIVPDQIDPQTREVIPGRESTYNRLGSKDFVNRVVNIGRDNPEAERRYMDFMNTSFQYDIAGDAIARMKDLDLTGHSWQTHWVHGDGTTPPHFALDMDGNNDVNMKITQRALGIKRPGTFGVAGGETFIPGVSAIINGVNKGIAFYSNVADAHGISGDAKDKYIFEHLQDAGLDPEKLSKVGGIPESLAKSMAAAAAQRAAESKRQEQNEEQMRKPWQTRRPQ